MVVAGVVRRHPRCKIILSHAGGSLPYLAARPANMLPFTPADIGMSAQDFLEDCRAFYFNVALSGGNEAALPCLAKFAMKGHVLFGSDFPYAPGRTIEVMNQNLDMCMREGEREAWNWVNAETVFQRLGALRKATRGLRSSYTCRKR